MGLIVISAPIALERSSVEKLNESSLFHSHVWDNELEVEFRRETVSRDRIWIPAGLLTMVFLWVVLLGFSFLLTERTAGQSNGSNFQQSN